MQISTLLVAGSVVSVILRDFSNSLLLYLPIAMGIVLVHWFGPKILPLTYLNGLLTLLLWKSPGGLAKYMIVATHEPAIIFFSWLLARKLITEREGFNSTSSFAKFAVLGLAIPDIVNCFYTYHYTFINGDLSKVLLLWLSDFITTFCIGMPVLHFLKPSISSSGLLRLRLLQKEDFIASKQRVKDLFVLGLFFFGLNFVIDFYKYWFVYGVCASVVALRRGYNTALLANFILFSLSYLVPVVLIANNFKPAQEELLSVHLGMTAMFIVSALIGRVVSDFRAKEDELNVQKKQLETANGQLNRTNSELDRFVYSVSHDISAPLKSIKGLVTLSRLDKDLAASQLYLNKIETSVQKLEGFIGEVLDHSRTVRKDIKLEIVHLESFIHEISEDLKYIENFGRIKFQFDFKVSKINTDRFLLKVTVGNLLSNAIKYQKRYYDHQPEIKISSSAESHKIFIHIEDNGEGIANDYKDKIFEMFYRGTSNSSGSGLGLYIAKEAIEKLKGSITFQTTYGKGSIFTITLPIQIN